MSELPIRSVETTGEDNLALLMQIISLLPNAVHIKTSDHIWVEMNDAFATLMGYTREEMIGKTSFDVMPRDEAELAVAQDDEVLRSRGSNRNIKQLKNHKGETRWVEAQKCYFKSASGKEYVIGVLTDLTELKQREADLVEARERAQSATRARAVFLANMGSDIRDPMNRISKMARELRDSPLDHHQLDVLGKLERSGNRLFRIIDDIMDYSRIDAGLMSISNNRFNPNKLVENLAASLGPTARDKRLDLIVSIDPNLPEFVHGDRARIKQVLMNLTENALKYTSKGHVHISVGGRVLDDTATLAFTVKDSGPGIPPDKLKDVMADLLETTHVAPERRGVSGLGLSLCRRLAHLMGGRLDISSRMGKGTDIRLTLTVGLETNVVSMKPVQASIEPVARNRILIVDDIRANYDALRTQLKRLGMTAEYAANARVAARKLASAFTEGLPYSLVLVDYLMPEVDGLLFVNSIARNQNYADTEIIVLSSVNDTEVEECFTSTGLATYLCKPVHSKDLELAIKGVALRQSLKVA